MNSKQRKKKGAGLPRGIPAGAQLLPHKRLREGEATGHAHVAVEEEVRLYISGDQLLMRAPHGSEIVHEEHHTQQWAPDVYRIDGVREQDHFAEEARAVAD